MPVYPVKGYSLTIPTQRFEGAPRLCLTDESAKLAISPLGHRLRVAGTAELGGYDAADRCGTLRGDPPPGRSNCSRTAATSPALQPWAGLRPTTPGNVPDHRTHAHPEPVPEHRPRHARLDARVRLRACHRGHHRGAEAGGGVRVCWWLTTAPNPMQTQNPTQRRREKQERSQRKRLRT